MKTITEKYKIAQDYQYQESDWWNWQIWIDASDKALDKVEYVEYTLHPTFANPIRKVTDRSAKFQLKEEGWGEFTVYAKVVLKDGLIVPLEHELELTYPGGEKLKDDHERNPVNEKKIEQKSQIKREFPLSTIITSVLFLAAFVFAVFLFKSITNTTYNSEMSDIPKMEPNSVPAANPSIDNKTVALDSELDSNSKTINDDSKQSHRSSIELRRIEYEKSDRTKNIAIDKDVDYDYEYYASLVKKYKKEIDQYKAQLNKKDKEIASLNRKLDSLHLIMKKNKAIN